MVSLRKELGSFLSDNEEEIFEEWRKCLQEEGDLGIDKKILEKKIRKVFSLIKKWIKEEKLPKKKINVFLESCLKIGISVNAISVCIRVLEKSILDLLDRLGKKPGLRDFCERRFDQIYHFIIVTCFGIERNKRFVMQKRYTNLFENLGIPSFVYDEEGKIFAANHYVKTVLHLPKEKIIGRKFMDFIPKDERKRVREIYRKRKKGGKVPKSYVSKAITPEGERIVRVTASVIPKTKKVIVTLQDITQRRKHQERLERLNKCFRNLGPSPENNIQLIVETAGEIVGGTVALYNRLQEDGKLCSWAVWNKPPAYEHCDDPEGHVCTEVIRRGSKGIFEINDLKGTKYEKTDPNVKKYGLRSYISKPVSVDDVVKGSFCVVDVKPREFTKGEKEVLRILGTMISVEEERLRNRRELEKSRNRFKIIAEQTGQLVYDYNLESGEIKWLGAISEVTGYDPDWFQRVNIDEWLDRIHPNDREAVFDLLKEAEEKNETFDIEYRFKVKGGRYIFVRDVGAFLKRDDQAYRMLGRVTNITARKRAEERLRKAYEELKELDRLKTEFIHNASHELKSPITTLRLVVEEFKPYCKSEEAKEVYEVLSRNVNRVADSVSDLLNLSAIHSGRMKYSRKKFNLKKLLEQKIKDFRLRTKQKDLDIEKDLEEMTIIGDPLKLSNVFSNLLDNAVKFTQEGRIKVVLEKDKGLARIKIKDTGRGMTEEQLSKLFTRFYQADKGYPGLGLGLIIAKEIVEAHDGEIKARSPGLGKGSTFIVELPITSKGRINE